MKRESATETYLRQATRGLWGKKRLEVREELAAHLQERVLAHQIGGLDKDGALERALSELGNPREVSLGMARLYTLPTLLGSGAALAAACVCVVALLPKGTAQTLPVTSYWPSARCIKALDEGRNGFSSGQCSGFTDIWFNQQALKKAFEPQGITFGSVPAPEGDTRILRLAFPESTPVYLSLEGAGTLFGENGSKLEALPGYLSFWSLLRAVSLQTGVTTSVDGWDNPTVRFNNASLKIATQEEPITGRAFYDSYMEGVYFDELAPWPTSGESSIYLIQPRLNGEYNERFEKVSFQKAVLNVSDTDRNAYGIAMRLDPAETFENTPSGSGLSDGEVWDEAVSLSVSRADAEGNINFRVPKGPLHFVESFTEELDPGAAILVKLNPSGTNWYEVVAPESIAVQ